MATTTTVNWDVVLEGYGPEAREGLIKILRDYEINDDDAVAALIASMFVSQLDTMRAFQTISEVIEKGKDSLSDEFKEHIISLRGIISFAEEHLVEAGKEAIEQRQKDLLDVVRAGIAKAIHKSDQFRHFRSTAGILLMMGAVGLISIVSALSGVMVVQSLSSSPTSDPLTDPLWAEIAVKNAEAVKTCIENTDKLEHMCVIEVPK
ncbi:MAG: hypothetical protein HC800_18600 [Phormidesmis sp. RL_2_1]|nr:hypothetical protein [Phormidesmis sp. RL_2_1]